MPSPSRRRLLRATTGLLGGLALAGCNDTTPDPASPTPSARGPPTDALTDPPTVHLRNPAPDFVVTRGDAATRTDDAADDDRWRHALVADAGTASSLTFADVEEVDRARQFLDDTDFTAETVYVEQRVVDECFERTLCWVRWTDDSIETAYASTYRDADVSCETDATDAVADLIRLPVALDPERVREFGSGTTSGQCRPPRGREENG